MATDLNKEILEKLDTLVRLQALALVSRFESSKERILFLGKTGLGPKEIADLLQTTPNHVNVTLSKERASRKARAKEQPLGD